MTTFNGPKIVNPTRTHARLRTSATLALDAEDQQPIPALLTKALIRKHYLPAAERTLDRWVAAGQFPRPDIAIGGKVRYWKRETVERWIEQQAAGGQQ